MTVQSAPEVADERLVQAVLNGDRDAFGSLVERYKRGISSFISASVRQPSDVADLTQETFLRAYAHLGTFNPDLGRFSTWLYHIARNVVRTFLGRSLRRPPVAELAEEQSLENAVADPSERTRTVLSLRFYDNMDYQTIATTMGLSLGNVKTLIHRGKLALAHKLRERETAAQGNCATRNFRALGGLGELQLI